MSKRAIAALALFVLTGCSTGGITPAVDKAGVPVGPVTLRAWTPEVGDRPTAIQLATFAEAVQRLSNGAMTIETRFGTDPSGANPDATVIAGVQSGDYDIGLAAGRAFSEAGVDSFRALTAPFLIQTDAVAAAVASDDQITGPMLAGLGTAGLTGLAIVPETIRHPFGVSGPILGPDDYRGALLRSLPSKETYAVFAALGAKPGFWEDGYEATAQHGPIPIVESSFALAGGVIGEPVTGTGNVAFFPRMNVLFVNSQAAGKLSAAQHDVLSKAAVEAREQTITDGPRDAASAALYCANGGRVVLASDADVAALHAAAAPYLATLAKDPTVSDELTAMRDLAESTAEPDPVKACEPGALAGQDLASWPVSDSASPIDGRYRVEVTDADLEAVRAPQEAWAENHGVFTWEIAKGRVTMHQVAANPLANPDDTYDIVVRGHKAMLMARPADGSAPTNRDVLWIGTWSRDDDGALRFTDYEPGLGALAQDRAQWFAHPFTPLH